MLQVHSSLSIASFNAENFYLLIDGALSREGLEALSEDEYLAMNASIFNPNKDRGKIAAVAQTILDQDEFIKPRTTMEGLASLKPAFEQMGAMGFDAVALQRYPQVERIHHLHHAGKLVVEAARARAV